MTSMRHLTKPQILVGLLLTGLIGGGVWLAESTSRAAQIELEPETTIQPASRDDISPWPGSIGQLSTAYDDAGASPVIASTVSAIVNYSDVDHDAYYYEAVQSLGANGVFDGTDCGQN